MGHAEIWIILKFLCDKLIDRWQHQEKSHRWPIQSFRESETATEWEWGKERCTQFSYEAMAQNTKLEIVHVIIKVWIVKLRQDKLDYGVPPYLSNQWETLNGLLTVNWFQQLLVMSCCYPMLRIETQSIYRVKWPLVGGTFLQILL